MARGIHVWVGKGATVVAWGLTAIVVFGWIPLVHAQFLAKEEWPYAQVATFLRTQMEKSDVIVTGRSIGLSLSQFFDNSEDRIMLPDSYVSKVASNLDGPLSGRVFYVTGPGFSKDAEGACPAIREVRSYHLWRRNRSSVAEAVARRSIASNCRQYCRVLFKATINYSRCSKRRCHLAIRQIIGVHSQRVAGLRGHPLVIFHTTYRRPIRSVAFP